MNWSDLFTALALVLVIEGILPFINPGGARRALVAFTLLNDGQLRFSGLAAMLLGMAMLFFIRF